MSLTIVPDPIAAQQAELDELDDALTGLIRRRVRLVAGIERERRSVGLPGIELARENRMLDRYRENLGRPGVQLALLLLGLSRMPHQLPEEKLVGRPVAEHASVLPSAA